MTGSDIRESLKQTHNDTLKVLEQGEQAPEPTLLRKQLHNLRKAYGAEVASLMCGTDERTYNRWCQGKTNPNRYQIVALARAMEVHDLLEMIGIPSARAWLLSESSYLAGRMPLEVLRREPSLVLMAARALLAGRE